MLWTSLWRVVDGLTRGGESVRVQETYGESGWVDKESTKINPASSRWCPVGWTLSISAGSTCQSGHVAIELVVTHGVTATPLEGEWPRPVRFFPTVFPNMCTIFIDLFALR